MFRASSVGLVTVLLVTSAVAQDDGPRLTKPEERRRFHPVPVTGTPAAKRFAAFAHREKMKAQSPFGGLKWRNIGPMVQGGRVLDIAAPANDPETLFVAFATGGLYRTNDDGLTWDSIFDDQSAFGIGAIAVSRDGKTIWVGSGEANSQRTSYAGSGVFKSTDGGKSWANVGLPESHHIGKIVLDPRDENVAYVAVLGHLYSQNEERGVYKTSDGGKTWQLVLKADLYTGAIDLVIDPSRPDRLLASLWDRDRRAWNFRESGVGSAVMRTENGGKTWLKVTSLPVGDAAGRTGLALCASKPNVVYAFVDNQANDPDFVYQDERAPGGRLTLRRFLRLDEASFAELDSAVLTPLVRQLIRDTAKAEALIAQVKEKKLNLAGLKAEIVKVSPDAFVPPITGDELYRSDDAGRTFRRVAQLGGIGGYYWGKTWVNPANADDVYVMGLPLLRSTDGGKTWSEVADRAHVDHHAVWNDPRDPRKVWIGNDGGLYLSYDGGKTVRHINNLSVAQATTVAVDNKRPYNVFVGLQDNGTMKGPSTHRPGISDPNEWKSIFGGDGSHIAVDPRNDGDLVYVAIQFGLHFAFDQVKNERWRARFDAPRGEPAARYNWVSPLIISSYHPDIVYLGSQRLYRSFNQGRKWEPISPDLTKNRPNGDVPHSTIKDISESPFRFGLIYVGCDDGNVKRTDDGGSTWVDIATPQPDKWVSRVVASKYDENTVYVSQNGYREDDFSAYLWKSTDRGRTWTSIVGNLPAESINVIREDPARKDILYVGTDMGVYVSFDGGATWETLHGQLPTAPVHDLVVQPRENDLVIGTHSRGAYVLPLKWVHRTDAKLREADLTILEAEDLRRTPQWGYAQRERWDSTPAPSPKTPLLFFAKAAGKGTLRLKDKDGKVVKEVAFDAVRGYNTVDLEAQLEGPKPIVIDRSAPKNAKEALRDPYEASRAKFLAVGKYTLEIQVGDKTISKEWEVRD